MNSRKEQLDEFRNYLKQTDFEMTMVLQNLQWDRKNLLKDQDMQICKYNTGHRIPTAEIETHEKKCYLKSYGYLNQDLLLPDPVNLDSRTLVKLSHEDIKQIIFNVSNSNNVLRKGIEDEKIEPMSLERLQSTYTVDERRAIYDMVVAHTPSQSDISELELPGVQQAKHKPKTKLEVLAELRDMKRRRPKYRVATKSKNYSEVLREVIKNQMEWYAEIQGGVDVDPKIRKFKFEKEDWKKCDDNNTKSYQINNNKPSKNFKIQERDESNKYAVHKKRDSHGSNYNAPTYSNYKSSSQMDSKKCDFKHHKEKHSDYDYYKGMKNEKRSKHRHGESQYRSYHKDQDCKDPKDFRQKRNREY
ncbi:hypothetical protein EVAR_41481_1 [Eumeta japonica]|uniref:CHHC U11-48K-type domain-containing protein n=1 Tax=Eumeta variegata TaxID=151549 RepID=A0A4C1X3M3_EUMVA|nr:hypothetical protein EVAR_41481_1 [Eumeta japonica]